MPDKKFELGDYVEVKDRIKLFYELFGQGRLVTGEVRLTTEPDGVPRVMVQGLAYRSPDDPLPGVGWSWLQLPGSTPYTRGSEIENAETSAWGRAIGALGILIDRSIASSQEVQNKQQDGPQGGAGAPPRPQNHPSAPAAAKATQQSDDGGLIGTAVAQGTADFQLRQSPDGYTLPFRVKEGSKSFIVLAHDALAEALAAIRPTVLDQRVTVWGHWGDVVIPGKTTYQALHLERIATPDGILPAPVGDTPMPEFPDDLGLEEPPEDVPLVGEKVA